MRSTVWHDFLVNDYRIVNENVVGREGQGLVESRDQKFLKRKRKLANERGDSNRNNGGRMLHPKMSVNPAFM